MTDSLPGAEARQDRRGFTIACVIGALCAAPLFVWMLNQGTWNFVRPQLLGTVFDQQAHSLLHGHWDLPRADLQFEAFIVDGRAYTYFGPWPAILRMPVVATTSHFDGRLTQCSMLLGYVFALVFASITTWRIRTVVRRDEPVTTLELTAIAVYVLVLGAGSGLFFLGSRAIIYHEPEMWGAALAIAAFDRVLAYLLHPSIRNMAIAGAVTTVACLARGSVGAGAVFALGLILLARLMRGRAAPVARWLGVEGGATGREVGINALAVVVPIACYAYANFAKFGTLFSVPWSKQVYTSLYPNQLAMLRSNGGSLFGLKFVPTTLFQYARPDAFRFRSAFPFVTFPPRAHVFGNVFFDVLDRSSSVTATMPLLVLLGVVGVIAILRSYPLLRIPLFGTIVATGATLAIAYIANRYLADFMPLVVVASATGLHVGLRAARSWSPRWRTVAAAVFVVLAAFGVWVNFGLAYMYQRYYSPALIHT
jgi:hypothetical protein